MELLVCFVIGIAVAVALLLARTWGADFPAQKPDDYAEGVPSFDLKTHLNGKMICEGVIYGPFGRVSSSFVADFDVQWQGDTGVMKEHFRYNDGSTQNREWTIVVGKDGHFTSTAPDVPGQGRGILAGSAAQMRYKIQLPPEAGGHVLNTIDWMYLAPNGTVVNRSQFRKFGVRVAELVATIRPVKGSS